MKFKLFPLYLFLIFNILSCYKKDKIDNKLNKIENKAIKDSVKAIDSTKKVFLNNLIKKENVIYSLNKEKIENNQFLSEFIYFFNTNDLKKDMLVNQHFYERILFESNICKLPGFFEKNNYTFSLTNKIMENYGKCFIAEFLFKDAPGYMQIKYYVIVNSDKNEISIWNFDNIIFIKKGLKCDFNVRGNHSFYYFKYLKKYKKFVLIG